jgi:hypothetical protein
MEKYGLYLLYASDPLCTGTKEECRAHVDGLTDAQRKRGWTIAPIPPEPYNDPIVDPALAKRIWIASLAVVGIALIAVILLLARRYT